MTDAGGAAAGIASMLAEARSRLADVPQVRLGEWTSPPRWVAALRPPRIVPRASAWHLGVVLLGEAELYATGDVVRASDPGRRGYAAQAARTRAEWAAAARRGGFAEGEPAHVGWRRLDLGAFARTGAEGPLAVIDGTVGVRWSPGARHVPLEGYLAERIELLRHPPAGAT
ncbi:glutaminase [Microbacterium sp. LRZ72]|uniref:glutaminase n=1 Tax=Microbacterium sp. LRZ72 TaxID=2942481 RepID=UPI0029AAE436|nr:glutaminase [Microbacterium sp. LRZ72]MDX2376689.1 glutaminase [Microbacterium sp. LRZ72]